FFMNIQLAQDQNIKSPFVVKKHDVSFCNDSNLSNDKQYSITYIIGNKFYEFSKSSHVISVADFFEKMEDIENFSNKKQVYYFGQGVSELEQDIIVEFCKKNNVSIFHGGKPAESALTHKVKQENTMITEPFLIEDNTYRSNLIINDDCAEMSDHVTGRHIQGMVLIEAARQMMLAVSEKYILGKENQGKAYCILNNIITTFKQFVFPIDVVMNHKIMVMQATRNGVYAVKCRTQFIQNNQVTAEIEIEYKLYDKNLMLKKEQKIAEKCLEESAKTIKENHFI
ncbi:MAG: AfsA-related hotdog domain-containing protein, partial [Gammaproteobacteria bacterium]